MSSYSIWKNNASRETLKSPVLFFKVLNIKKPPREKEVRKPEGEV
jgi:hypothetical protein